MKVSRRSFIRHVAALVAAPALPNAGSTEFKPSVIKECKDLVIQSMFKHIQTFPVMVSVSFTIEDLSTVLAPNTV